MAEEEISTQALDADQRITPIDELTPASAIADTDLLVIEHADGGTESATVQQLKNGLETASHASNTYSKIETMNRFSLVNGRVNGLPVADLNNISETSLYNYSADNVQNSPLSDGWGFVLTMIHTNSTDYAEQTVFPMNSSDKHIYTRIKSAKNWEGWKKLYNETPFSTTFVTSGTGANYLDLDLSVLANVYGRTIIEESSLTFNYMLSFSNGDIGANGSVPIGYGAYTPLGYNKIRLFFNQNCSGAIRINYTAIPLF